MSQDFQTAGEALKRARSLFPPHLSLNAYQEKELRRILDRYSVPYDQYKDYETEGKQVKQEA